MNTPGTITQMSRKRGRIRAAPEGVGSTRRSLTPAVRRNRTEGSMESTHCAFCAAPLTKYQQSRKRRHCSKSCAGKARSNTFRGVKCSAPGCNEAYKALGYCEKHYQRIRTKGTLEVAPWVEMTEVERFWSKVDKSGDCWIWTGSENHSFGYGYFATWSNQKRTRHLAHRYVFRAMGRELDPTEVVRHQCDNPPCVRPGHLLVGTQKENVSDALHKGRLDLSGLRADTQHSCSECGVQFMGVPSRRYCDAHRVAKAEMVASNAS